MQILAEIFSLEGIKTYSFKKTPTEIKVRVASVRKKIPCNHCGSVFNKYGCKHSNGNLKEYQHGTLDSRKIILVTRRNRFRCPECNNVGTEPLGNLRLSNGHLRTKNYDDLVLDKLAFSPSLASVAKEFDISESKVRGILLCNTQKGPWLSKSLDQLSDNPVLGIDEKHWLKRQYHLVLTSITDRKLLALGNDRKKSTLIELLNQLPEKVKPLAICIDMWAGYKNAAKEVFGKQIPVIVDKFHVFSLVNRKILESKDILEYKRKRQGVANYSLPSFRPLLYSRKRFNMSKKAKEGYKELIHLAPELKYYRDIRNMVEDLYKLNTYQEAEKMLDLIIKLCWDSPCSHGIDIANNFQRWSVEILNYFDYPYTNAFTEGMNNNLELINRIGYGYKNKDIYLRRASLLVK